MGWEEFSVVRVVMFGYVRDIGRIFSRERRSS